MTHKTTTNQQNTTKKFLRLKDVLKKIGMGPTSVHCMRVNGEFPKPFKLSKRAVAWLESDIEQWMEEKERATN